MTLLGLGRGFPADLRLAARRLLATPLFSIFAVLSLAVGVGVTTAVYSVVDSVFLKRLGFRDPEQVVFIVTPYDGRFLQGSISEPDFQDVRAVQTSFSSVSAAAWFHPAVATSSTTELLAAEAVDGAYFSTLGVSAATGRTIQAADEAGRARVVVLSDRLWRARFRADPKIVGHTIRISGHPFEVIGVAERSFEGATGGFPGTRLWIPLSAEASLVASPSSDSATLPRDRRRLLVFGRLRPRVTVASASAELTVISASLDAAFPPRARGTHAGPSERPWKAKSIVAITEEDNSLRRFGFTIIALVGLVLVVACTNLANLVLARGTIRLQEFTVRCALGAPRWRLVREQCAESLLLALGGAVATNVVFQGLRVLMDAEINLALPMGGRWTQAIRPEADAMALGVAAASLLMSLVVFGLEPAWQLTRSVDIRGALATGGAGRSRTRRQRVLLRWQVAIAAGFFIIATMFVKYTIAEARHDSGVEMERLGVAATPTAAWTSVLSPFARSGIESDRRKVPLRPNGIPVETDAASMAGSVRASSKTRSRVRLTRASSHGCV